jgi:hypothetical protein
MLKPIKKDLYLMARDLERLNDKDDVENYYDLNNSNDFYIINIYL